MNSMFMEEKYSILSNSGGGLLNAEGLLKSVFPEESTRPSLSWLRRMQAKGVIPFKKVGGRIFFDATEVRRSIDENCTVAAIDKNLTKAEA